MSLNTCACTCTYMCIIRTVSMHWYWLSAHVHVYQLHGFPFCFSRGPSVHPWSWHRGWRRCGALCTPPGVQLRCSRKITSWSPCGCHAEREASRYCIVRPRVGKKKTKKKWMYTCRVLLASFGGAVICLWVAWMPTGHSWERERLECATKKKKRLWR